jgi:hypothetical protein
MNVTHEKEDAIPKWMAPVVPFAKWLIRKFPKSVALFLRFSFPSDPSEDHWPDTRKMIGCVIMFVPVAWLVFWLVSLIRNTHMLSVVVVVGLSIWVLTVIFLGARLAKVLQNWHNRRKAGNTETKDRSISS